MIHLSVAAKEKMLSFELHHDYRRPSVDDPHAAQPIPDTREMMGLTEKGNQQAESLKSLIKHDAKDGRVENVKMTGSGMMGKRCSECGAVSIV